MRPFICVAHSGPCGPTLLALSAKASQHICTWVCGLLLYIGNTSDLPANVRFGQPAETMSKQPWVSRGVSAFPHGVSGGRAFWPFYQMQVNDTTRQLHADCVWSYPSVEIQQHILDQKTNSLPHAWRIGVHTSKIQGVFIVLDLVPS